MREARGTVRPDFVQTFPFPLSQPNRSGRKAEREGRLENGEIVREYERVGGRR